MFYCDPCRRKRQWPESLARSRGSCEVCGQAAVCYDMPSPRLSAPGAGGPYPDREHGGGAEATRYRYFVTYPGEPEREVDVHEWRAAEQAAGFWPKLGPGHNATAGFGGKGIRGRMQLIPAGPGHLRTGRLL
jgi:hypothetical protein